MTVTLPYSVFSPSPIRRLISNYSKREKVTILYLPILQTLHSSVLLTRFQVAEVSCSSDRNHTTGLPVKLGDPKQLPSALEGNFKTDQCGCTQTYLEDSFF